MLHLVSIYRMMCDQPPVMTSFFMEMAIQFRFVCTCACTHVHVHTHTHPIATARTVEMI